MGLKGDSTGARKRMNELKMPIAKRIQAAQENTLDVRVTSSGSKEVSFVPKSSKSRDSKIESVDEEGTSKRRRGIKDLGFKQPFKNNRRR